MILFTADIDWACEDVIADTLSIFEQHNTCCTLFATHPSETLRQCNRDLFELGLHPNFNPLLQGKGGSVEEVLAALKSQYPEARGIRSHSLTQSGPILNACQLAGAEYEVNHFLPYHTGLQPFRLWNGMLRIPFNWEDDYHFALHYPFDDCRIDLNSPGLKIFNFHPIHIFLNSENEQRYNAIRHDMHNVDLLLRHRNTGPEKGVRDMLLSLLAAARNGERPLRLYDLCKNAPAVTPAPQTRLSGN